MSHINPINVTSRPPSCPHPATMIQLFPHRLIAGYVLSNATSLKSMMAIEGTEPSDFSHSEGEVIIPNTAVIERAITAHIAAKLPESEGKVAVTLTGTASEIEIILVTQECLLAKGQRVEPPPTNGDRGRPGGMCSSVVGGRR